MKRREISNSEIELLFNKIIEQAPLVSEEQATSLLHSLPMRQPVNATKNLLRNHLNTLLIGAILVGCMVGVLLWFKNSNNSENTLVNQKLQSTEVSVAPLDTLKTQSTDTIGRKIAQKSPSGEDSLPSSSSKSKVVPVQKEHKERITDSYLQFDEESQLFAFPANRDTTLLCKEGTTIKVKANSWIGEQTGKEIAGLVHLTVKEYYKITDIVMAKLSTTSGEKILETGGMLYISATSGLENCLLKEGEHVEVGFPFIRRKAGMSLFKGIRKNALIDWQPVVSAPVERLMISDVQSVGKESSSEPVFVVVEEMPEFPGGELGLKQYIRQNAQYPFSALKNKKEGKVFATFVVDKLGYTKDIGVVSGFDNNLDRVAVYLISKMPVWKPARQRGVAVSCRYTVRINFALKDTVLTDEEIRQSKELDEKIKDVKFDPKTLTFITNNKIFNEVFEKKIKEGNFLEATVNDLNRYVFRVSQLEWINCDRFDTDDSPKANFSIVTETPDQTIVSLVFHRINAVVTGSSLANHITFKNVPLGEKITIVAIRSDHDKLYLAIKESEISIKVETDFDFKPVTMKMLKKLLEGLNQ